MELWRFAFLDPMKMLTEQKIIHAHQVFAKYSCYGNEKKKNAMKSHHKCDLLQNVKQRIKDCVLTHQGNLVQKARQD